MILGKSLGAALGSLTLAASSFGAAHAAVSAGNIYNIDATSSAGVSAFLAAGTYQVSFIGTNGGAYTAYDDSTGSTYTDDFAIKIGSDLTRYYVGTFGDPTKYSTAAAALSAYQTASSFIYDFDGAAAGATNAPITFTLATAQTVDFVVGDTGGLSDNSGGVSIKVSPLTVSAAPEPETWALMMLGVGMIGGVLSRRKRAAAKTDGGMMLVS